MSDEITPSSGNGDAGDQLAFDYIKSQYFRVIRADGMIGSVTPNGFIHVIFFSERPAIPRRIVYKLTSSGELGPEIESERVSRDSVVREMDADLFINLSTAISFRDWLTQRIDELKRKRLHQEESDNERRGA